MISEARQRFHLWRLLFHKASEGRWRSTLVLTLLAYGLFMLVAPPVFYWLGAGIETTGQVMRDNHTVRYDDLDGQRHIGVLFNLGDGHHAIWGMPVRVRYLSFAPGISWLLDNQWEQRALFLFVAYVLFVILPLSWLWATTILRPALQAWQAIHNELHAQTTVPLV